MEERWAILFFHTYWFIEHEGADPLKDHEFLKHFVKSLTGRDFQGDFDKLSEQLDRVRGELYPIIVDMQHDQFDDLQTLALLNKYLGQAHGRRTLTEKDHNIALVFEPDSVDEAYVLSEFASVWYTLLFLKERSRIRICEMSGCECLFLDESKNNTKRFCTEKCGNVAKARRHRSRVKATKE